jgi:hypothetical protein
MQSELYFDISSETNGGSLYKTEEGNGKEVFVFEHSIVDETTDEIKVHKTTFNSFDSFWKELSKERWFYMHPLFVHPDIRPFIKQQLQHVDWSVEGDFKWQDSHRRQWTKVLTDPGKYYRGHK